MCKALATLPTSMGKKKTPKQKQYKKNKKEEKQRQKNLPILASSFCSAFKKASVSPPGGDKRPSMLPEKATLLCAYLWSWFPVTCKQILLTADGHWLAARIPTAVCLNGRRGQRGGDRKSLRRRRCSRRRHSPADHMIDGSPGEGGGRAMEGWRVGSPLVTPPLSLTPQERGVRSVKGAFSKIWTEHASCQQKGRSYDLHHVCPRRPTLSLWSNVLG